MRPARFFVLAAVAPAQPDAAEAATRAMRVDRAGVIRWRDDGSEVALFGANYTLPSASDYRAAGRPAEVAVRVVDATAPDSVILWARPVRGGGWFHPYPMRATGAVGDRLGARGDVAARVPRRLTIRLRGLGVRQVLHVTLVERDGTSWGAAVAADGAWAERSVPLSAFTPARGVLLPEGFPGEWNYCVGPAAGRGGPGDAPRPEQIERLQLSLRAADGAPSAGARGGFAGGEGEWVDLALE